MKKFKAHVRLAGNSTPREVRVEAINSTQARQLLEGQYGRGSVVSQPQEIR